MLRLCAVVASLALACGIVSAVDKSKSNVDSIFDRVRRQTSHNHAAEAKCTVPGPLQNGRYYINPSRCPPDICILAPGAAIPSGWDIFFECDPGYSLSTTSTTSICKNGRWSTELPTCFACGSSTEIGTIRPLISHGKDANVGAFPWHAGLYFPKDINGELTWVQDCGGSLINSQFVVTAAHCVIVGGELRKKENVRIGLGKQFRSWDRNEDKEQKRNVASITYQQNNYNTLNLYFDIALIMMDKKVEFGRFVMPVCFGTPYESNHIANNKLFVAGWGLTQREKASDILQYTDVAFLPRDDCEERIPSSYFLLEKLCTQKEGSSDVVVREGDSGGGLTVVYKGHHYIVGIVSLNLNQVTLFTNINFSIHKAWMEKEINKNKPVTEAPKIETTTISSQVSGSACSLSETTVKGKNVCSGKIVFEENFSGPLNDRWSHNVYISDHDKGFKFNVFDADEKHTSFKNGSVVLRPTVYDEEFITSGTLKLEGCTSRGKCESTGSTSKPLPPVASSRMHTYNSWYFRYGEVEFRAKLPVGDWLGPEVKMLSRDDSYGSDLLSGYIMFISRGNSDFKCNGVNYGLGRVEIWVTLGPGSGKYKSLALTDLSKDWYDQYHTFTVVWKPGSISFKVDNDLVGELEPVPGKTLCEKVGYSKEDCKVYNDGTLLAPFDKEFYLIMGLTAGNTWFFGDHCKNNGKPRPWKNFDAEARLKFSQDRENWQPTWTEEGAALYIDYIRVTAL